MKIISTNNKAKYEYFLSNNIEAGIVLEGNEIKNVLKNGINLKESYVKITNNEVFLLGANIHNSTNEVQVPDFCTRPRKLLLHKNEIRKFVKHLKDQSTTIVCINAYFSESNKIKLEIALAKGKKLHDKRNTIKERDLKRKSD
jgi:SsrA-binding protein